ncbi:MAG: hypothetical protein OEV59_07525 [Deltaproteobacteria bacterium]|nr:hypothetical protein [Deltaproteobacteria bacterium]
MRVRKKTVEESLKALLDVEKRAGSIYRHFASVFKGYSCSKAWEGLAVEEDVHAHLLITQLRWLGSVAGREVTVTASDEIERLLGRIDALEIAAKKPGIGLAEAVGVALAVETSITEGNIVRVLSVSVPELLGALKSLTDDCEKHLEFLSSISVNADSSLPVGEMRAAI